MPRGLYDRAIDPFGIWMDGILAAWFSSMRVYKAAPP